MFKASLLVIAATVPLVSAGIEQDIETLGEEAVHGICVFAVGKLEGDLNGWVCGEVGVEAIGLAATFLAGTGLLEALEDPIVGATAGYFCAKGLSMLESDVGLSPNDVCSDLGINRHVRRSAPSSTTATYNFTSIEDVMAAWDADNGVTATKWLNARAQYIASMDAPVAVYADGTTGYCFPDQSTGLFSCIDSGYAGYYVNHSKAGALATTALEAQASGKNSASNSHSGAVAAAVVLAVVLVGCATYTVTLQQRISKLEAAAAHGRGGGEVEAATQAFAPLMEESHDDADYAEYTD